MYLSQEVMSWMMVSLMLIHNSRYYIGPDFELMYGKNLVDGAFEPF